MRWACFASIFWLQHNSRCCIFTMTQAQRRSQVIRLQDATTTLVFNPGRLAVTGHLAHSQQQCATSAHPNQQHSEQQAGRARRDFAFALQLQWFQSECYYSNWCLLRALALRCSVMPRAVLCNGLVPVERSRQYQSRSERSLYCVHQEQRP